MQLTKWAGKVPYLLLLKCSMTSRIQRGSLEGAIIRDMMLFCETFQYEENNFLHLPTV